MWWTLSTWVLERGTGTKPAQTLASGGRDGPGLVAKRSGWWALCALRGTNLPSPVQAGEDVDEPRPHPQTGSPDVSAAPLAVTGGVQLFGLQRTLPITAHFEASRVLSGQGCPPYWPGSLDTVLSEATCEVSGPAVEPRAAQALE